MFILTDEHIDFILKDKSLNINTVDEAYNDCIKFNFYSLL